MFARRFALFALLLGWMLAAAPAAHAEITVAAVNMQQALQEIGEGKTAKARLDKMMADKNASMEKMKANVEKLQAEYEQQKMLLSDSARSQKEEEIQLAYMQFQQVYAQSQQEMQATYENTMATLIGKMKTIVGAIATERKYTVVVETGSDISSILYAAPTVDITAEVVKRYNAANPTK